MDVITKVINDLNRKWNQWDQEYTFKPTKIDEKFADDWVGGQPNQIEEVKILISLQKMQMAMINKLRAELQRIEKIHSTQSQVNNNFEDFIANFEAAKSLWARKAKD